MSDIIEKTILNKQVAIVGNATSLLDKRLGDFIDSHEVVIRLNKGCYDSIRPRSHGSKIDFAIFNSMNIWDFSKVSAPVVISHDRCLKQYKSDRDPKDYLWLPRENYESIIHKLDFPRPSMGAIVLNFLDSCNLKSLSIFGFDWNRTPTWYEIRKNNPHNFDKEREYFIDLISKKDNWKLY